MSPRISAIAKDLAIRREARTLPSSMIACAAMPLCSIVVTASRPHGLSLSRFSMSGALPKPQRFRNIRPAVGDRKSPIRFSNAMAASGMLLDSFGQRSIVTILFSGNFFLVGRDFLGGRSFSLDDYRRPSLGLSL